jgi:hypothetical protein
LPNFAALINRYPSEQASIARLVALVNSERKYEMTFEHLVLELRPASKEALALILAEMAQAGAIRRVLRVESQERGGIQDFESLQSVPARIHDWRTDMEVDITLENLRVIYKST